MYFTSLLARTSTFQKSQLPDFPSASIPCNNMAISSALLHLTNFRNPFVSTLIPSVGAAFAIQAAFAVPSIVAQSERFYDVSGSLTYLSVTALSLYLPAIRARAAATAVGSLKPAWPSLLDAFTGKGKGKGGANGLNWRQVVISTAVAVWATRCEPMRCLSPTRANWQFSGLLSFPARFERWPRLQVCRLGLLLLTSCC